MISVFIHSRAYRSEAVGDHAAVFHECLAALPCHSATLALWMIPCGLSKQGDKDHAALCPPVLALPYLLFCDRFGVSQARGEGHTGHTAGFPHVLGRAIVL